MTNNMKIYGSIFSLKTLAFVISVTLSINSQAQNDAAIQARATELVKKMTLEEKVGMIHGTSSFTSGGVARLGIPQLVMSDGPHGVRPEHGTDYTLDKNVYDSSTYLPTGVCLAATWNPQLGYAFGSVLGSEAAFQG